ncbi:MAG: hypothetical protein K2X87_32455 [Gemmataceae bacterium]|nr:hypothetical protein [Gemmataceae bacterium]
MTSITITDPALLAQFAAAAGTVEIKGPDGRVVTTVSVGDRAVPPPGFKIPLSDEELARRSQIRIGRPVADILRDLKAKYGE